jgi:hypothetical protein
MRRLILRLVYLFALMATAFAIGAELGWQELPNDVKRELGGYGGD